MASAAASGRRAMLSILSSRVVGSSLAAGAMGVPCLMRASRSLHTSIATLFKDVLVPPMGESITEATVSTVVAKAGQQVNVDEPIVQLETDKVTIDVRAPVSGLLDQIMVKVSDVVKPGDLVAIINPAAQGAPASKPGTPAPSGISESVAAHGSGHAARVPSIKFPPRMTPDGRRISDLPAAEQAKYLGDVHVSTPAASSIVAPTAASTSASLPASFGQKPPPRNPELKTSPNTVFVDDVPRRKLSAREIDAINLGGAW